MASQERRADGSQTPSRSISDTVARSQERNRPLHTDPSYAHSHMSPNLRNFNLLQKQLSQDSLSRKLSLSAIDSADRISDISESTSLISVPETKRLTRKFEHPSFQTSSREHGITNQSIKSHLSLFKHLKEKNSAQYGRRRSKNHVSN